MLVVNEMMMMGMNCSVQGSVSPLRTMEGWEYRYRRTNGRKEQEDLSETGGKGCGSRKEGNVPERPHSIRSVARERAARVA